MLFLTRSRTKFVYESKRTEVVRASRFLREMKNTITEEDDYFSPYASKYSPQTYHEQSTGEKYFEENKPKIEEKQLSAELLYSYKKGDRVHHKSFGDGIVTIPVTDPRTGFITVKFDKFGNKTLSLKFAPLEKI